MSAPPNKMVPFLKRFAFAIEEDGLPEKVVVLHDLGEGQNDQLGEFKISEGMKVEDLAIEMYDMAEQDASTRTQGTPQRYVLLVFRHGKDHHEAAFPFSIRGKTGHTYVGEDTEQPNERGVTQQLIRQNENQHRMIMHMAGDHHERLTKDLENERAARIRAEEHNVKMRESFERLQDMSAQREIQKAQELSKIRRNEDLMQMIFTAGPAIVGILAGKFGGEAGPAVKSVMRDQAVKGFLGSIRPEQFEAITRVLRPDQQMGVIQLMQSYADDDKADQDKRPKLLRTSPDETPDSESTAPVEKH